MPSDHHHVLIEMSDEPDCRFVAGWLTKVADAQKAWMKSLLDDPSFRERIGLLHADGIPDLESAALELFGELEYQRHVAALDLYPGEDTFLSREFALLVLLGFFAITGESYKMVVPDKVSPAIVKWAARTLLLTVGKDEEGIEIIRPELVLCTLSADAAKAWRTRLIATRRFAPDVPRAVTLQ